MIRRFLLRLSIARGVRRQRMKRLVYSASALKRAETKREKERESAFAFRAPAFGTALSPSVEPASGLAGCAASIAGAEQVQHGREK